MRSPGEINGRIMQLYEAGVDIRAVAKILITEGFNSSTIYAHIWKLRRMAKLPPHVNLDIQGKFVITLSKHDYDALKLQAAALYRRPSLLAKQILTLCARDLDLTKNILDEGDSTDGKAMD